MRFRIMAPILSLLLALLLSITSVAVLGAPPVRETAVKTAVVQPAAVDDVPVTRVISVTEDRSSEPDVAALYRMLMLNRVFGDALYDDETLINEAEISLVDSIEQVDGMSVIRCETVNRFIKEMYGRTVINSNDSEYYAVSPRGYEIFAHEIADISDDSGQITVRSYMRTVGSDPLEVVTVFSPCENGYGYIIISADIVG